MRTLFALVLCVTLSHTAFSQQVNLSGIEQIGHSNKVMVEQLALDFGENRSNVTQIGSGHEASIHQENAFNVATSTIRQTGDRNVASVYQSIGLYSAIIDQAGRFNTAIVSQSRESFFQSEIYQVGVGNDARVTQGGVFTSGHSLIVQNGANNLAVVDQGGVSHDDISLISIVGDDNHAIVNQATTQPFAKSVSDVDITGNANYVEVQQHPVEGGDASSAVLLSGDTNHITVSQETDGFAQSSIEGVGQGNVIGIRQSGPASFLTSAVDLIGDSNSVSVTQVALHAGSPDFHTMTSGIQITGDLNEVQVSQGSSNSDGPPATHSSSILVQGNSNTVAVVQD